MSARISCILVLHSLLICRVLVGQAPATGPGEKPFEMRTTTREVLLDLVVRDKHQHPITDLRPEEVELYEDGVRQEIKVFNNVQGKEQLQTEQRLAQGESATPTDSAGPEHSRNTLRQINFVSVIFAQIAPLNLEFAHRAVLEFLKSDSLPNTYVAVYSLGRNLELKQPYTSDKDSLLKAADSAAKGVYSKDSLDLTTSLASSAIAEATSNLAKQAPTQGPVPPPDLNAAAAMVQDPLWVRNAAAQDASVNLGSALSTEAQLYEKLRFVSSYVNGMNAMDSLRELVRSQENLSGRKVVLYLGDGLALPAGRRDVVDDLISFANRSGVTFYTVDTQGLNTEDPMTPSLSAMQRTGTASATPRNNPKTAPMADHEADDMEVTAVSNTQLALRELAESTGGFIVANTNEIAAPMQRVMEDMRNHYELAYTPTSKIYDGHFRKIEVKISRPKVTLQTRKGYYALPELNGEPLQPYEAVALRAINSQPSTAGFPYQAALIKFRSKPDKVEYQMAFEIPLSGLKAAANPKTGKAYVRVSLFALVHDASGEVVGKVSRDLMREVSNQAPAEATGDRILYAEPLDLPRGNYAVDTAVTDEQAGNTTVRRLAVSVDPGTDLGLSSLEIIGEVKPSNGTRNPLDPFDMGSARILPTLADSLPASRPLALFFIVYPAKLEAGEDAKVTLQLFQDGKEVARRPVILPQAETDGSVPVSVELSPRPGQCDITITAQQGKSVKQSSRSLKIE
jgi:VWFA-related protein